ncbi:MAG: hypothetical protein KKF44_09610 [Nanoarchaeota archaeon]|nr:hypothetical protein [Nanoarchaeota archaeon]
MLFKKFWKKYKKYDKIAHIGDIGRRVFANNSFDGILTIMGIILGSMYAGIKDPIIVIKTGIGASIAMGVSGAWGAYYTEKAERIKEIRELEKVILKKMKNTSIEKAAKFATKVITAIDGLSPFLSSMIVIIPFFMVSRESIKLAYIISLVIAFALLALLGAFLGKISKGSLIKGSFRMMVAGIVCIILTLVLQVI